MSSNERFSERFGFKGQGSETPISVRYEAPHEFRGVLPDLAYECGLGPTELRKLACRTFRKRPDPNNWSEYPNINDEARRLIDDAEWYQVYDLVEVIASELNRTYVGDLEKFQSELNRYLVDEGIGWKLHNESLVARNPEAIEQALDQAKRAVAESGAQTAQSELHEAIADLSRRPQPDLTGAIQHAMASLECMARRFTGSEKATLGELLKKHPDLVPQPLPQALEKLWGYSSEYGRHLREGREPPVEEAQLIVGVSASLVAYLAARLPDA